MLVHTANELCPHKHVEVRRGPQPEDAWDEHDFDEFSEFGTRSKYKLQPYMNDWYHKITFDRDLSDWWRAFENAEKTLMG